MSSGLMCSIFPLREITRLVPFSVFKFFNLVGIFFIAETIRLYSSSFGPTGFVLVDAISVGWL
jgi:hypothetical protein